MNSNNFYIKCKDSEISTWFQSNCRSRRVTNKNLKVLAAESSWKSNKNADLKGQHSFQRQIHAEGRVTQSNVVS